MTWRFFLTTLQEDSHWDVKHNQSAKGFSTTSSKQVETFSWISMVEPFIWISMVEQF
jgi:hypothetical protein